MKFSDETDKLWPAIMAVHMELDPKLTKSSTANAGSYKYDYSPLEDVMAYVRPVAHKHGLLIIQGSHFGMADGEAISVSTAVIHAKSGQFVKTTFCAKVGPGTPAQEAGKVNSYGRRYDVLGLFCLTPVGEDTDASPSAFTHTRKTPVGKYDGPSVGNFTRPVPQSPKETASKAPKKTGLGLKFGKKKKEPKKTDLPTVPEGAETAFSYEPEV